jgi:hypothetical protein
LKPGCLKLDCWGLNLARAASWLARTGQRVIVEISEQWETAFYCAQAHVSAAPYSSVEKQKSAV